jgi:predicted ArsR family transcriptional regulator
MPIIGAMTGLTISEMAARLNITPDSVLKRLQRAGIKPISREVIYDTSALEAIRNVPGRGRPKKAAEPKQK